MTRTGTTPMANKHLTEWIDHRWHVDGRGIHAGNALEVQWPDGTWQRVRIETGDCGRKLFACFDYHGLPLSIRIAQEGECDVQLRWPEGT